MTLDSQRKQYYDQLKASSDIAPFIDWFDMKVESYYQAIKCWPQEQAIFERLIKDCEQAKKKMISEHQTIIEHAAMRQLEGNQ
ncbi:hypothetical protein TUM4261_33090 [Shewanella sp. c952]|uniref:hypothetical protein n=1 Tax=Shewanella sp. c952 TaxID=2815913 RepID=UPI001BB8C21B|nr:hypothetical protein [Shewanella sp. c952]GIU15690.1 hypothetical protein TUM4261_33090 [Shewanella sp. c952]